MNITPYLNEYYSLPVALPYIFAGTKKCCYYTMKTTLLWLFILVSFSSAISVLAQAPYFKPGLSWPDTDGIHINAHGGGILYNKDKGTYFWFGEYKIAGSLGNSAQVGVSCYSSSDLFNWKNEGIALKVENDTLSDIQKGCIIERPKVVYNNKTKKYVMWFHLELKSQGYAAARTGVAIADKPEGPYTFIKSLRPNAGVWPVHYPEKWKQPIPGEDTLKWWTKKWEKAVAEGLFIRKNFAEGQMSRDMTIFVDDDGKAYHIYASEENLTLHIAELTDDYLSFTGKWMQIFPAGHNEAPAMIKYNKKYYLITSGCTGWAPNAARSAMADSIWGPWVALGNPCVGKGTENTFQSQSTYIIKAEGVKDVYIFMADRWVPNNPIDGSYVWLPLAFENSKPVLRWYDQWNFSMLHSNGLSGSR
jgi:hypothetical protein